jgi:hypothetical protein
MHRGMAFVAQRDQVRLGILAGTAAKLFVVNFKIGHRATRLASPTVAAEHLVAKLVVQFAVQAKAWVLWSDTVHEFSPVA